MKTLTIFKQRFVDQLLRDAKDNLTKYHKDKPWALDLVIPRERDLATGLTFREDLHLLVPAEGNLFDLENAVRIHKAMPRFSRLQARDPRLWTRLAHVECWDYMRARWGISLDATQQTKNLNKVVSRYFVRQSQSRALLRNGISRLWWLAEQTFDETRTHPYELTETLLATLDITQSVMERNFGRSDAVTTAFLETIGENKKELVDSGNTSRYRVRKLAKFLNMQGGVCILDTISKDRIKDMLSQQLEWIIEAEKQDQAAAVAAAPASAVAKT
jgi:hypothetical protein